VLLSLLPPQWVLPGGGRERERSEGVVSETKTMKEIEKIICRLIGISRGVAI